MLMGVLLILLDFLIRFHLLVMHGICVNPILDHEMKTPIFLVPQTCPFEICFLIVSFLTPHKTFLMVELPPLQPFSHLHTNFLPCMDNTISFLFPPLFSLV